MANHGISTRRADNQASSVATYPPESGAICHLVGRGADAADVPTGVSRRERAAYCQQYILFKAHRAAFALKNGPA